MEKRETKWHWCSTQQQERSHLCIPIPEAAASVDGYLCTHGSAVRAGYSSSCWSPCCHGLHSSCIRTSTSTGILSIAAMSPFQRLWVLGGLACAQPCQPRYWCFSDSDVGAKSRHVSRGGLLASPSWLHLLGLALQLSCDFLVPLWTRGSLHEAEFLFGCTEERKKKKGFLFSSLDLLRALWAGSGEEVLAVCLLVPWGKWGGGAGDIWLMIVHSMALGITHSPRGIMQHLLVTKQKRGKESMWFGVLMCLWSCIKLKCCYPQGKGEVATTWQGSDLMEKWLLSCCSLWAIVLC